MLLSPEELAMPVAERTKRRLKEAGGTYYWVRWIHDASFGVAEIHFPNWTTGAGNGYVTRVAAICGSSVNDVMEFIRQSYDNPPKEITFTFVELRERDRGFSDRFDMPSWALWFTS